MNEKYTIKDFGVCSNGDILERADSFQCYVDQLDQHKHRAYFIESKVGVSAHMTIIDPYSRENKSVISFISNDYLGLSKRKETIDAGIDALIKYGTGACAAPIIGGYMSIHKELENKIANFVGQEDALIFSSGFGTNSGILTALLDKQDIALVDSCIHSSVYEGLHATNVKQIGHNNIEYLEMILQRVKGDYRTKLVIIDGVYSQDGDIAKLPQILKICKEYGAYLMVDDAHGIGVVGINGRGIVEHYNLLKQVDIITGTFSKSFGCVGGFVAASTKMIQYLRYYTPTSVFSAAMTPQVAASVLSAIKIVENEPEIRQKLWSNIYYMRQCLKNEGFDIGNTESAIFPIMVRDDFKVKRISRMLLDKGFYAIGICYPAVSTKEARIRISLLATHERDDINQFVQALCEIDQKLHFRRY